MSSLSSDIFITPQDLYSQISNVATTVPYDTGTPQLGVRAVTGDGREFRRVQAGGSNLIVGNLLQSPAQITNHHKLTPTAAAAVGDTSLTVTLGNTLATANQYLQGWVIVESDSGSGGLLGPQYQISGNPAANASATLKVQLADPLINKITTSAALTLQLNPYSGVIQNPTTATGTVVGVAIYAITASYYGWVQIEGIAPVLYESTASAAVGANVSASVNTAGAVEGAVTAQAVVGYMAETPTTTNAAAVKLMID